MKRFFIVFLIFALFASCKNQSSDTTDVSTTDGTSVTTTTTTDVKPYYVKNSIWQDVDIRTLAKPSSSRSASDYPSLDDALAIVSTYNAENNSDQLRLYTTDIPVTEAPTVDVYIVRLVDGNYINLSPYPAFGLDRADFIARHADFESDAKLLGGVLFVDKVPPAPVVVPVVDTRTRHEKYSIYMVNKFDKVVVYTGLRYEKHIDEIWDSFDDATKAGYYNNIDNLMNWYIQAFQSDAVNQTYEDAPWRVVYGQIYTEPTE